MEAAGLIHKVEQPRPLRFHFEDIRKLPPLSLSTKSHFLILASQKKEIIFQY
jgi:ATP-binding cassette subfamily F protein 2